jgi:hypothetical protein
VFSGRALPFPSLCSDCVVIYVRKMSRNAPKRTSWPFAASLEGFGQNLFKGAVAAPYLKAQGLSPDILESHAWTTDGNAEKVRIFTVGPWALQSLTFEFCLQVAAAVLEWAKENDATMYTHWFQPMSGSGLRHGLTGQVHNSLLWFDTQNRPSWKFEAKNLLRGETDGSSFLNGGMRATHTAGAYIAIDPTSPLFIRNDTMFIPSCLVSYDGKALDEKVPLLRAGDALSREGVRLLKHLGYNVKSVVANIGLEQEFFLVPRESFNKRPDLQLAGRTVTGKKPPRGQELCDHCKYLFCCLLRFVLLGSQRTTAHVVGVEVAMTLVNFFVICVNSCFPHLLFQLYFHFAVFCFLEFGQQLRCAAELLDRALNIADFLQIRRHFYGLCRRRVSMWLRRQ